MDIRTLVNISSRAWAVPILSSLHAGIAGRQAPLLAATGASRTAFALSMEHLIKIGLLERNPGYGHPLRPEFRLTHAGIAAAAMAHKVYQSAKDEDRLLLRRSWTLPVLSTLRVPSQFNEIKRTLPTITDRALSQSLKTMEEKNWVERRVDGASRPPRSIYHAVNAGGWISQITAPDIRLD